MPCARSWMNVVLLVVALSAGCRLPGREGPVSSSLAECRRLSRQGVSALERGRQEDAEALLAKAVAACPTDAEAHRNYAEALWHRGIKSEAIAQMETAARISSEDAAVSTRLAEMYLAVGQPDRARQNADRALELDPKSASAWAIRGGVARAAGQPREALNDYLRALRQAPHDRAILQQVAELYRQLNEPQQSLQTLQCLAETYSPGDEPGQVLYLLGQAYVALGRYDDGLESLASAVTRENPTPEMYYGLAEAELLAGHAAEAAAAARQALTLDPRHAPSRQLLDRIEVAARQPEATRR